MQEEILYNHKELKITNKRLIFNNKEIPIGKLERYFTQDNKDFRLIWWFILIFSIAVGFYVIYASSGGRSNVAGLGGLINMACALFSIIVVLRLLFYRNDDSADLYIIVASKKIKIFSSDWAHLGKVCAALEKAIEKREEIDN